MSQSVDVAAYIWPAYHDDPRSRIFWPQGRGEWETVLASRPRYDGHKHPREPLWGPQNEADPRVMEMQIDAAADHGVNVFIYDWYWYDRRPFLEACLAEGFLGARNHDRMRFFIMWANHHANTLWDRRNAHRQEIVWLADVNREEFETVGRRHLERFLPHPACYRIGDRPLFAIYDVPTFVSGLGGVDEARDALAWWRQAAAAAGLPGLHLQAIGRRSTHAATGVDGDAAATQAEQIEQLGFDSVGYYQWVHLARPVDDFIEWGETAIGEWLKFEAACSLPVFPHVSVGWDNCPRFPHVTPHIRTGVTPENFRGFLEQAVSFVRERDLPAPMISVNSWNEWTETSYLLPDREFGYGYLEAIRDVVMP